jgi:hypothetical protein
MLSLFSIKGGADMNFYPDKVKIKDVEYEAQRDSSKGEILVPYTEEPDVGIGDKIVQLAGKREINLKVLDVSFRTNGSLGVGTRHPNMLTIKVENLTAKEHASQKSSSIINIGSLSGENVQVGNDNSLILSITIQQLTENIAKSDDEEAKSILKSFFENNTVASVIGAGVSTLINML